MKDIEEAIMYSSNNNNIKWKLLLKINMAVFRTSWIVFVPCKILDL